MVCIMWTLFWACECVRLYGGWSIKYILSVALMRHYTPHPHLQVNEQQLNRNSQDERGKEIMPFVWGISANVGILGWILHCSRSNINFLKAHSRSVFKNRPTTVWCIDFTWQQSAFYSESFGRCSLLFKHRGRSNTPHPISSRPAVSWSTFLLYLRYHPLGGPSRPGSGRSDPGLSCTFVPSLSHKSNF